MNGHVLLSEFAGTEVKIDEEELHLYHVKTSWEL